MSKDIFDSEEAGDTVYDLFKDHSLEDLQKMIKGIRRSRLFVIFPYLALVALILEVIMWLFGSIAQEETIQKLKLRDIKEIAERFPEEKGETP